MLTGQVQLHHLSNIKAGDLVEWYYVRSNQTVCLNEMLFSTGMNKWLPVSGVSILISIENHLYFEDNTNINFINSCGKICKIWYNNVSPKSGLSTVGPIRMRKLLV
jgi:hypothetical protein